MGPMGPGPEVLGSDGLRPPRPDAPVGSNADATNTILDDGIRVFVNSMQVTGRAKLAVIGWRGFVDAQGVYVDDFGNPTNIASGGGDIQPAPVLIPAL